MASLKDLRNRINSVKATQKITKAMQMVAAAKLRRAQEAAESARPFAERMDVVIGNLGPQFLGRDDAPTLLVGNGKDQRHLFVVAAADRGLCGGFNSSIVRNARQSIKEARSEGKDVKVLCVGQKAYDQLRRDNADIIIDTISLREVRQLTFKDAQAIGDRVVAMFEKDEFDQCSLFYAQFKSVIAQEPVRKSLIPAELPDVGELSDGSSAVYDYEPGEEEILQDLLPRNVSVQIFRALLENAASEQGARMSAMDNATRNAGDMIQKLTLVYNRTRQAQITKELIEIISGAEAL